MPLELPNLDDRRYQELLDEALARIPVHTPEWTNFNQSDPGYTLIQVFAFIAETLLYRANRVPELNRQKFLQLLGVPLRPASSARAIVTFNNERGSYETITLNADIEVRAGQVPFRTENGLDVLPVEAVAYFKEKLTVQPGEQREYYKQLYASFLSEEADDKDLKLYESVPLASRGAEGVDLSSETIDNTLWIALLLRAAEKPATPERLIEARELIGGKTLSLGLVPMIEAEDAERQLLPGGRADAQSTALVNVQLPSIPASGGLPDSRQPDYRTLEAFPSPFEPEVFEVTLPAAAQLTLWDDLDPLEPGSGKLPPTLEDTAMNDRLITWLKVTWPEGSRARLYWAGINATFADQRARVVNELLPDGTGEPDQGFILSKVPVLPGTVKFSVTSNGVTETWAVIDDLLSAGPEVPTPDLRLAPGVKPPPPLPSKVCALDAEAGHIRFGDGLRGARPPLGATLRVSYDYGVGADGNVGEETITTSPALPAGLKVTNPVRTWGGADAETVSDGEKQVARFLQHRDRLVSAADFEVITLRTPGVEIARVEVLSAYNPSLARNEPGNAPGAVTLMLIPKFSPTRPDAPEPDQLFLKAVCDYLDPRRLVTTELFLCGPEYKSIWISIGIEVVSGRNFDRALVREAVKEKITEFLAPIRADGTSLEVNSALLTTPVAMEDRKGWPLRRAVLAAELEVEVARVPGVAIINKLELAGATGDALANIALQGLQLPRLDGIVVSIGDALPIEQVRGDITSGSGDTPVRSGVVPVPVIPKEC
jgi:hypothetical protein